MKSRIYFQKPFRAIYWAVSHERVSVVPDNTMSKILSPVTPPFFPSPAKKWLLEISMTVQLDRSLGIVIVT